MLPDDATIEQRMILGLLSGPASEQRQVVSSLAGQVDWEMALQLCPFPLFPYLHHSLQELGVLCISPEPTQARLESAHRDAVMRYMRRRVEVGRVCALLGQSKIPVMLFKGFVLAEEVYPKPYLRFMQDVDLLIHERDFSRVEQLLISDGYSAKVPLQERIESPVFSLRHQELTLAKVWQFDLVMLEFHSTLHFDRAFDAGVVDEIWSCSRSFDIEGMMSRSPSLIDLLSDLCVHLVFYHHLERSLLWMLDLRLFLERYGSQVDWDELGTVSRVRGTERYVSLTLHLLHSWFDVILPERCESRFPIPGGFDKVSDVAWKQMWFSDPKASPPRHLFEAVATGSPQRVWRYLTGRGRRWGNDPMPGSRPAGAGTNWMARARGDLRRMGKAAKLGALKPANLLHAYQIEQRRRRLSELVGMERIDPEGAHR